MRLHLVAIRKNSSLVNIFCEAMPEKRWRWLGVWVLTGQDLTMAVWDKWT